MNVLIIHNSGDRKFISGELEVLEREASKLKKNGINCIVKILYNDEKFKERHFFNSISILISILWSFPSFFYVLKLIKIHKPDIVHFHSILPLLTPSAFFACKISGVPVVQTLHNVRWLCVEGGFYRRGYCDVCLRHNSFLGVRYLCSRKSIIVSFLLWLLNVFYKKTGLIYRLVDQFIAVSEFIYKKHLQAGFPSKILCVKYNPLPDLDNISLKTNLDRDGITFVGRLSVSKGSSIIEYIAKNLNITFNIIGDGHEFNYLNDLCKDLEHVKFLGKLSHKETLSIISKSKCVVVPSKCGESFSLVTAEALICGTPVVGSNLGGIAELIFQSEGGILIDPEDHKGFVEAIKTICNNDSLAKMFSKNGINFANNVMNKKGSIESLINIYKNVINRKIDV